MITDGQEGSYFQRGMPDGINIGKGSYYVTIDLIVSLHFPTFHCLLSPNPMRSKNSPRKL